MLYHMAKRKKAPKQVETLTHEEASRTNIPTAEYQSVMDQEVQTPIQVAYQRRNRDLDPQLVWRGKDEQDCSDLVAQAPPLFIQEKVHPKVLIDDLLRRTARTESEQPGFQTDLFADFNGLPDDATKTEFYQHEANWSNRMITRKVPSDAPTHGDIRQGFVYERVPHITLKSIANNAEIDIIWERWQETLEPLRAELNAALGHTWEEWQIPREPDEPWNSDATDLHRRWWEVRVARQQEIDASIAAKADYEYLCDKPYKDTKKIRVAGPFTVESVSPHRVLAVDEHDDLVDRAEAQAASGGTQDFATMILENLRTAGVQQAHKEDKIVFSSLTPWPGTMICAEGHYEESGTEKRAAILLGPEFGTVTRPDLVEAAREAGDARFDVLIACSFNYDAHASEFSKLGRIPVLKARMNADLHMADNLKNTGKGNLFVIFGEPDIDILPAENDQIQVKINGVDVFHPSTGEVRSNGAEGIACWFIDTDYNEESFFVRHAYFLGANDPYKALKTSLKAEINQEAWETLHRDRSRPFDKPASGRIAVKVINHLGDEVMKVFRVD